VMAALLWHDPLVESEPVAGAITCQGGSGSPARCGTATRRAVTWTAAGYPGRTAAR